jgi:REP-associated tyrosine transposase
VARKRKRHVQLGLERARKQTGQGGWRRGAGRKCKPGAISHDTRPAFPSRFPQHVTLRLGAGAPSIARAWLFTKVIRPAIAASKKPTFAVVEFNVLSNHVHLIVEAEDALTLARGVQGLAIRIARRVNSALNLDGKLFGPRYHARSLRTPREVRNALRYVLLNRKHHAAEQRFFKGWIDPYSSAIWFRGWQSPVRMNAGFNRQLATTESPVALPRTWLLRVGWQKAGALSYDDRPAG